MLQTPKELLSKLDNVVGQEDAKKDLVVAVYYHYLGLAYREARRTGAIALPTGTSETGKQHILLLGPTGVGKTSTVRTLAKVIDVPCYFAAATSLVETGYKGISVDQMIEGLWIACGRDAAKASRGILFIDEMDKIRSQATGSRDVSGEGVQNALLSLMDGREVRLPLESSHGAVAFTDKVDTSTILVVCTGAFTALTGVIRGRLSEQAMKESRAGISRTVPTSDFEVLCENSLEDWKAAGYIPELIGRFSVRSVFKELGKDELKRILAGTVDSVVARQAAMYAMHGISLSFTNEAIHTIADLAIREQIGARGLDKTVIRLLNVFDAQLPELVEAGVCAIKVGHEFVEWSLGRAEEFPGSLVYEFDEVGRAARVERLSKFRLLAVSSLNRDSVVEGERFRGEGKRTVDTPPEEIPQALRECKTKIGWDETTGSARKWWDGLEQENRSRLGVVLWLARQIEHRKATITDFFMAYVYSNTDDLDGNLYYMDYQRVKKASEMAKRARAVDTDAVKLSEVAIGALLSEPDDESSNSPSVEPQTPPIMPALASPKATKESREPSSKKRDSGVKKSSKKRPPG